MEDKKSTNIVWHHSSITKEDRERRLNQQGVLLWFTGLSGSGKSTIANAVARELYERGRFTYLLDGDNMRHGLNKDLTFSPKDRKENVRRIGEVGNLFIDAGLITLAAFVSPSEEDRRNVRKILGKSFIEVFIDCPLEICEKRDPKGLYKKARNGEIKDFTGIGSSYEVPMDPEIVIHTDRISVEESVEVVLQYLKDHSIIKE